MEGKVKGYRVRQTEETAQQESIVKKGKLLQWDVVEDFVEYIVGFNILPGVDCNQLADSEKNSLLSKIEDASQEYRFHNLYPRISKSLAIKKLHSHANRPYERLFLLMEASKNSYDDSAEIGILESSFPIRQVLFSFMDGTYLQEKIMKEVLPIAAIEGLRGNFDPTIDLLEDLMDKNHVWYESKKNQLVEMIGYLYFLKGDSVRAECNLKEAQRRLVSIIEGPDAEYKRNHQLALVYLINGIERKAIKAFERAAKNLPIEEHDEYAATYNNILEKYRLIKSK